MSSVHVCHDVRIGVRLGPVWVSGRAGSLRWPRSVLGSYVLVIFILAATGNVPQTLLVWSLWTGIPLLILLSIIARFRARAPRS